jgi:23S rRNA (uracil1939-C5)-methyltransferase
MQEIKIDKLVHGGQGLGTLPDGKKVFVWNALPGEIVQIEMTKDKKSFGEAIATKIVKPSENRTEPLDARSYLSTSPWQIVKPEAEDRYKQGILQEVFEQEEIPLTLQPFSSVEPRYGYRNKMEYSFWWDAAEKRVRLAHFVRGSHERIIVDGSALALSSINDAGLKLIEFIAKNNIPSRELKSVVIRSTQAGLVHIALSVINDRLVAMPWEKLMGAKSTIAGIKLLAVRRNSTPADVPRVLGTYGVESMTDNLLGKPYEYGSDGFFQIHVPAYEKVLSDIKKFVTPKANVVDLYAGVGSIGMSITTGPLVCVESDEVSVGFAAKNIGARKNARIVDASSESALDEITAKCVLVVDPPRAGLHGKVVAKIIEVMPKKVVYLSCNPATQARDINDLMTAGYKAIFAGGYNFFPTTPHIESLVILEAK